MDQQEIVEQMIENENIENKEDIDLTEIKENLSEILQNPIDLNIANEKEFEKLTFLTCFKINMILEYREKNGPFLSIFELNGVEGLSLKDIQLMLPFVKIENSTPERYSATLQQVQLTSGTHWPLAKGYEKDSSGTSKYAGDPFYTRFGYRLENNNFQAGITSEKDAGEAFRNQGFDFYSAYLKYDGKKNINTIIAGDYIANFGQGLVLWSGFSTGKSNYLNNTRKLRQGFARYSSVNENQYLRGIAASLKFGNIQLSGFASTKKIDASKGNNDDFPAQYVSSLKTSGMHALPGDLKDRKLLGENTIGGNLNVSIKNIQIGLTACNTVYSLPIRPDNSIENKHKFSGKNWWAYSFDYLVRQRRYELFGEFALSSNGGIAGTSGIQIQLVSEAYFSVLYRNFAANYFSGYASSFAQNSKTNNEEGLFMGLELTPVPKIKFTSSVDYYNSKWLLANLNEPQKAAEYIIESIYALDMHTSFSARYTFVSKKISATTGTGINPVVLQKNQKIRLQASFKLNEQIELKNRLEISFLNKLTFEKQNGYLAYQDLIWKPAKPKIKIALRYAFFETDGWDSRIYAYENDLLNSFGFQAFYGKGARFYFLLQSHLHKNIRFSINYSCTSYFDRQQISSGPSLIFSNTKNELSCQLFILF